MNESHQLYIVEFWWPDKLPHKISAKSEHICSSYSILKIGKFYIQFLAPIINIWRSLAQARLYIQFTNKGGSRRPEKSRKNWIHFHGQGQVHGQGQCKGKLQGHGQGQCKAEVEGHGQEHCRGKVEGHGQGQ